MSTRLKLRNLLSNALTRVGSSDTANSDHLHSLLEDLGQLYIFNTEQLRAALEDVEVREQVVRRGLKGLLLPAVRAELKKSERGAQWRKVVPKKLKATLNQPLLRRIEIARADITQLSSIDQLSQTFHARVFIILRIAGGALDEHLIKDFDGFPVDAHGKPTFRPSARWCACAPAHTTHGPPVPVTEPASYRYLSQMDFPNGHNVKTLESKVTVAGDDLQLIKRVDGEFFERFELQTFPFDAQVRSRLHASRLHACLPRFNARGTVPAILLKRRI